jgi:predicted RNA binding protein YcfA (HicA-like mRNA interferase family)
MAVCIIHIMHSKALIKMLTKAGWVEVRIVGSHHQFKHPDRKEVITVPHPKKDLPVGTVNNILKVAGLK